MKSYTKILLSYILDLFLLRPLPRLQPCPRVHQLLYRGYSQDLSQPGSCLLDLLPGSEIQRGHPQPQDYTTANVFKAGERLIYILS